MFWRIRSYVSGGRGSGWSMAFLFSFVLALFCGMTVYFAVMPRAERFYSHFKELPVMVFQNGRLISQPNQETEYKTFDNMRIILNTKVYEVPVKNSEGVLLYPQIPSGLAGYVTQTQFFFPSEWFVKDGKLALSSILRITNQMNIPESHVRQLFPKGSNYLPLGEYIGFRFPKENFILSGQRQTVLNIKSQYSRVRGFWGLFSMALGVVVWFALFATYALVFALLLVVNNFLGGHAFSRLGRVLSLTYGTVTSLFTIGGIIFKSLIFPWFLILPYAYVVAWVWLKKSIFFLDPSMILDVFLLLLPAGFFLAWLFVPAVVIWTIVWSSGAGIGHPDR